MKLLIPRSFSCSRNVHMWIITISWLRKNNCIYLRLSTIQSDANVCVELKSVKFRIIAKWNLSFRWDDRCSRISAVILNISKILKKWFPSVTYLGLQTGRVWVNLSFSFSKMTDIRCDDQSLLKSELNWLQTSHKCDTTIFLNHFSVLN